MALPTVEIPNRSLFRQPEVCDIAQVQPYVLRSWEAEFPDLGVAKTKGGPRVYRRSDVERVLRLKHLLFVEGLTLAGARRRLADEVRPVESPETDLSALIGNDVRERITIVKRGLRELHSMLSVAPGAGIQPEAFELREPAPKAMIKSRATVKHAPPMKNAATVKNASRKPVVKKKNGRAR
jgi:DNA-binding transcriptional MerR regulator